MQLHRTLVLPDIHTPLHDEAAIRAVLQFAKYFKPHRIVQLGDFCDFNSLSNFEMHYPEEFCFLDDELDAARAMLDRIEQAIPKNCEKFLIGGNHEDRWHKARTKAKYSKDKNYQSLRKFEDSWGEALSLTQRGWNWCEYNGSFKLGKIVFTHGNKTTETAAKKMADQFPGHNVIFGHTHKQKIHTTLDSERLPIQSESIGTLSRFDLAYLKGEKPTDWVHGFMHIYTKPDGRFTKTFTHIIDGEFIANGRIYGQTGVRYDEQRTKPRSEHRGDDN
jgi:predicted phosphodiesterase